METDSLVKLTYLDLDDDGGAVIALLTLDRPDKMNPLDHDMVLAMRDGLREALSDKAVRMVAFTGAGRAFSAGGDMVKYEQLQADPIAFPQFLQDLHDFFDSLAACPVPVMALVNGVAVAGGLELILACDVVIASDLARLGDAHLAFGQMGGGGVLSRLPRQVGRQKARELMFSGRMLEASEAHEWGLVNRVVPADQLLSAGVAFGNEIVRKSALTISNVKQVMNRVETEGLNLDEALAHERSVTVDYCLTSWDAPEGLKAFADKRRPNFRGA